MKKLLALILVITMGFSLVACGGKTEPSETVETNKPQQTEENNEEQTAETVETNEPQQTEEINEEQTAESYAPDSSEPDEESNPQITPPAPQNNAIAKISGASDEVGIYSVVVKLTNQAADKGVIEMVYYGAKSSPQENSIVNTFRIEYYREDAGTFEIQTFFDGEVYQNQHHKDEVKVVNTFAATLRAGSVIISYTPDGGETQEIFKADAEYFKTSAN